MRLLFFAATAAEWRAACPQSATPLPEQEVLEFDDASGRRHALCITGVGPVNAALAAGLCFASLEGGAVDAVVNLGVAGSFDLARAPLGSAWRVTREIWPEYGLATDEGVDARALGFAQWHGNAVCAEEAIWDCVDLPRWAQDGPLPPLPAGIDALPVATSLTVAGVTADAARAVRLHARYDALLENMEGFALALACARRGLPLLELRTVSNAVGPRTPECRDFPRALAALQPLLHNILTMA